MSHCVLGVDCLTGGGVLSLVAGVAWSIAITFGTLSSSFVIVLDIVLVIENGETEFGRSFNRGWSVIRLAAAFAVEA